MNGKVRVYEVARDLGLENKALVALFHSVGVKDVKNHMSAVGQEQVDRVKRHLEKQSGAKPDEERIRPTVVKRRGVHVRGKDDLPAGPPPKSAPAFAVPPRTRPQSSPVAAPPPSAPTHVVPQQEEALGSEPRATHRVVARQAAPVEIEEVSPPKSAPRAAPPSAPRAAPPSAPRAAPPSAPVAAPPPPPMAVAPATLPAAAPPAAAAPEPPAAPPPAAASTSVEGSPSVRPSSPPKTGIDVWEGRPGVPMPKAPRPAPPRRVQYDNKPGAPAVRRGPVVGGGRMSRGPARRGLSTLTPRRIGAGAPVTQQRTARKMKIKIEGSISLQKLSNEIQAKAAELLMKLMGMGMTGININTTLDADTAKIVAAEFGWEVEDVALSDEAVLVAAQGGQVEVGEEGSEPRAPVVTVMGHVDHGKTSLLDYIRKASVATGEAGGITQHIGAYSVKTAKGPVTFLDTPGHAAFTAMRARGAKVTDLVILVVAADDGVRPQTKEAVAHAKTAGCPVVVAVNKMDLAGAQPERVRREMSELGLIPEEWGGTTLFCEVSARTGAGVDNLLESVALQAEVLDLRAVPKRAMSGVVVEAKLDKGRGPFATVLVTDGTLNRGDVVLAGTAYGKVRAMLDEHGAMVKSAGPADPVAIIGLNEVPRAGDPVHAVKSLKAAQEIAEERRKRERGASSLGGARAVSLEELARRMREANQLELKVVIKSDVQGSVEAIQHSLGELSAEKVKVTVVHAGVGAITESDVNLAVAARALIIGFNVKPAGKAGLLAQREGIEVRSYRIIYDVIDDVRKAMEGLLAPTLVEKYIGRAEIRKVFKIGKAGDIAGCMVTDGVVKRSAGVRILRAGANVFAGKVVTLKRFKDDAKEVREGFECGIGVDGTGVDGFDGLAEGDIIEAHEMEEVRQTLD